jgi:hypothetical protein
MDGHDGGGHDDGHDAGMGSHSHTGHDAYGNVDFGGSGQATWEALSIGYSHQGDSQGHFSGFGIMAHGNHCGDRPGGASHSSHSHAGGQKQQNPGQERCDVAPEVPNFHGERRMFVAHVVAHGDVNILEHLIRICQKYDVIRLDTFRPSMNGEDRIEYGLADDQPWLPPFDLETSPPAGWYPNATGSTRFIKQVWQVGRRPSLFDKGLTATLRAMRKHEWVRDPAYDPEAKTFFDVGIVTWNYKETGDHDTLITFRIASQLVWQRYFGRYGYKKIPFQKHQEAAVKIIQELLDVLKAAAPSEAQKRNREFYAVTLPGRNAGDADGETPPAPQPPNPPAPVDKCPPVPNGEVHGSGADLGAVVVGSPDQDPAKGVLQKVDIVVAIPREVTPSQ